jgi:hypothetical protein
VSVTGDTRWSAGRPCPGRGHVRATNNRIAADNDGHQWGGIVPAGRPFRPALSDTEVAARAAAHQLPIATDRGGLLVHLPDRLGVAPRLRVEPELAHVMEVRGHLPPDR